MKRKSPNWLLIISIGTWLMTTVFRYYYIFHLHPAAHVDYLFSDSKQIEGISKILFNDVSGIDRGYTLRPVGIFVYFALLYDLDPSWQFAYFVQFLISAAIPLLIAWIAHSLHGAKSAFVCLLMASLYYPFLEHCSFFLTEGPFLFLMLVSMGLLIKSLQCSAKRHAVMISALSGLFLGLAASVKEVALVSGLCVVIFLSVIALKYKSKRIGLVFISGFFPLLLIITALSFNCSRLNKGNFCLISTGSSLVFFFGHHDDVQRITFKDKNADHSFFDYYFWDHVATIRRGYTQKYTYDFGPYESERLNTAAWKWIRENPIHALYQTINHVFDLFVGSTPWPTSATNFKKWAEVYQQIFWVFILLPSIFYFWEIRKKIIKMESSVLGDILMISTIMGIIITAAIAVGSLRYRIPYDSFFIILAARLYLGNRVRPKALLRQTG